MSGVWSKEEVFDHINTLELKAVLLALQNLESLVVGHSLLICSSYMTVASFIIFQGGILSLSLCRLALDPVGMVSSEENFSSRGSHSRRRVLCGGFFSPGVDTFLQCKF